MTKILITKIRAELKKLSRGNEEYANFNRKIVNTKQNLIGVRMPDMRILAKSFARKMTFSEIQNFLKIIDKNSYEEVMLAGMLIGYAKISDKEKIELFREYLKFVDSWAQIDSIINRQMNSQIWWDFAMECLKSPEEFVARFGVILLMDNFLKEEFLNQVFAALTTLRSEKYYVKMAVAWLFATAAIVNYEKTLRAVEKLDQWTRAKALTKMLESYRITDIQKQQIRQLRDKKREEKSK